MSLLSAGATPPNLSLAGSAALFLTSAWLLASLASRKSSDPGCCFWHVVHVNGSELPLPPTTHLDSAEAAALGLAASALGAALAGAFASFESPSFSIRCTEIWLSFCTSY
jgi:hypothetical protein